MSVIKQVVAGALLCGSAVLGQVIFVAAIAGVERPHWGVAIAILAGATAGIFWQLNQIRQADEVQERTTALERKVRELGKPGSAMVGPKTTKAYAKGIAHD